jgi:hypothetical protein
LRTAMKNNPHDSLHIGWKVPEDLLKRRDAAC